MPPALPGVTDLIYNGGLYKGDIPGQTSASEVTYQIKAVSTVDGTGTDPETNPLIEEETITDEYTYTVAISDAYYANVKLNEVSGVGEDGEKFYELYNNNENIDIPLNGYKIYYNANGSTGLALPEGEGELTWEGKDPNQIIPAKGYFSLIGRHDPPDTVTPGSFTEGLTGGRNLVITLKHTKGTETVQIDQVIRAADTGDYAITDKSFSRIPDGTGPFYFTEPTPSDTAGVSATGKTNSVDTEGLTQLPDNPPVISGLSRDPNTATILPEIPVTISANVSTEAPGKVVTLNWKLGDGTWTAVQMELVDGVYKKEIAGQADGSTVSYYVSVTTTALNGKKVASSTATYSVSTPPDYTKLKLNEISGVGKDEEKFIELINTSGKEIPLAGVKIYYFAPENDEIPADFPAGYEEPSNDDLTWTGTVQKIAANTVLALKGAKGTGDLDKGLTASRILIIVLTDPDGNEIDRCIRASADGDYDFGSTKSFSRIGGTGEGPFYFTDPTHNAPNPADAAGLTKLPVNPPVYTNFTRIPEGKYVAPDTDVNVSVTITARGEATITEPVLLRWKLDGTEQTDITMAPGEGGVYTGPIPGSTGAVEFDVYAVDSLDESVTVAGEFTFGVPAVVDYTGLVLNEISGVGEDKDKFYELYNNNNDPINLEGVELYYYAVEDQGDSLPNPFTPSLLGTPTWTGLDTHIIPGKGFFSIIGRDNPKGTNPGSFTKGLTATRKIVILLKKPDGTSEQFTRAEDTEDNSIVNEDGDGIKSFSRIPDGTGTWRFTDPTPYTTEMGVYQNGKTNGTDTSLKEVPQGAVSVPTGLPNNPKFSLSSGVYTTQENLTFEVESGVDIYYSTDGSTPTKEAAETLAATDPNATGYNDLPKVYKYDPAVPIVIKDRTRDPNYLASAEYMLQMLPRDEDPIWGGTTTEVGEEETYNPNDEWVPSPYVPDPDKDQVPKATVIRAVAVNSANGKISEKVITNTYFGFSLNTSVYTSITGTAFPVLSLVTDPKNLVSQETGILIRGDDVSKGGNPAKHWVAPEVGADYSLAYNFQVKGDDSDRHGNLEFFDSGRTENDWGRVGFRVKGGYSRSSGQKSFNIYFGTSHGGELQDLNYPLVPGAVKADGTTPVTTFRNFTLRNGGNDAESTKFLDAFAHNLVKDRNFSTQVSVPCILFLNGEYWGPYNLQEKYGDNHTANKYDVDNDEVIAWDNDELDDGLAIPGASHLFPDMMNKYLNSRNLSQKGDYEEFCTVVDIDNLIDYFAAEIYMGNEDWPNSNYRAWRVSDDGKDVTNKYADGRWRYQMFDMDAIFGINSSASAPTLDGEGRDAFKRIFDMNEGSNDDLFQKLLGNAEFARKFVNTMMDLYNEKFQGNNDYYWYSKFNEYRDNWQNIMQNGYFPRWGYPYYSDGEDNGVWGSYVEKTQAYLNAIGSKMTEEYLPTYFGDNAEYPELAKLGITGDANGFCTVTVGAANIQLNTLKPANDWYGKYYRNNAITLTTTASDFQQWTITGGYTLEPGFSLTDKTINVKLNDSTATVSYSTDPSRRIAPSTKKGFLNTLKNFFVR